MQEVLDLICTCDRVRIFVWNMTNRPALEEKDQPDLTRFNWEDALRLNTQLTEDERALRGAARAYAQDRLQPNRSASVLLRR